MRLNGRAVMSLGLVIVIAWAVIKALRWPFNTALFPVAIGVPVFFLALNELWSSIAKETPLTASAPSAAASRKEKESQPLPVKETLWAFLLVFSFFFLILLVGFPVAAPLFVFIYLKVYGREKWGISIILTIAAGASFTFLFIHLLNIPFDEGWVQQGINALITP